MGVLRKWRYRLTGRPYASLSSLKSSGIGVELAPDSEVYFPERVEIGDYSYIGPKAYWYAEGGISIGRGVVFAPKSVIWTSNHDWKEADCLPYGLKNILKRVVIEDYVWIAFGVQILPGITVGEGAIIAMGSVVTKDVPPLAVVGGNPAKFITSRDKAHFEDVKRSGRLLVKQRLLEARSYERLK